MSNATCSTIALGQFPSEGSIGDGGLAISCASAEATPLCSLTADLIVPASLLALRPGLDRAVLETIASTDLPPGIWIAFGWSFLLNFPWLERSRMR